MQYKGTLPTFHHTRRLSSCRCVGCARSPQSLTEVSSRGFAVLPPSCTSKAIESENYWSSP
ncbi:hypothetical protein ENTCAN_07243 [Enterobacter cancerogenus ATCC 35316]|nr:hypothetical protein ENTCAN_07243 [Enterobacter cancerogenus ATCC 35316]